MEASDGEEEKSQESSEEKEEVVAKETRETAGRKRGRETQGWEIGRESCGETGSADDGNGGLIAVRYGRARGRTCPEPRGSLVAPMNFTP
jgi:hypothetical protein